jgi:hypothetical protein
VRTLPPFALPLLALATAAAAQTPPKTATPIARQGQIDHTYPDHVSSLKLIEAKWHLEPLSPRSRERLPNPAEDAEDPHIPANDCRSYEPFRF